MDPRARDFALRAAAKVSIAGSIFGCGNGHATPPNTGAATPTPTTNPTPSAAPTSDPAPTPKPTSNVCAPKDLANATPSEVACCTDRVHAAAKSPPIQAQGDVDCCKALAAWSDAQIKAGHGDQLDMPERDACCQALTWGGSITCTPWGPPVPPSIVWRSPTHGADRVSARDVLDLRREARAHAARVASPPHLRDAAVATWRGRMVNEHGSARVFEALAAQMREAGLEESKARACESFADEERRHGVSCGAVVEALGGEAIANRPRRRLRAPSRARARAPSDRRGRSSARGRGARTLQRGRRARALLRHGARGDRAALGVVRPHSSILDRVIMNG